jgi:hypothetical protein
VRDAHDEVSAAFGVDLQREIIMLGPAAPGDA